MKYKIDTLIFDFDGVIVDTSQDHANAVNYTLKQIGLAELPVARVAGFIGSGPEKLLRGCLGDKAASVLTCAVTYGFGTHEAIAAAMPDVTLERISQLPEWFD